MNFSLKSSLVDSSSRIKQNISTIMIQASYNSLDQSIVALKTVDKLFHQMKDLPCTRRYQFFWEYNSVHNYQIRHVQWLLQDDIFLNWKFSLFGTVEESNILKDPSSLDISMVANCERNCQTRDPIRRWLECTSTLEERRRRESFCECYLEAKFQGRNRNLALQRIPLIRRHPRSCR
mgnify:CR=1 FL=1